MRLHYTTVDTTVIELYYCSDCRLLNYYLIYLVAIIDIKIFCVRRTSEIIAYHMTRV